MTKNNKISVILFALSICFACSDKKDTDDQTKSQEQTQEIIPLEPKQVVPDVINTKLEHTFNIKGKDCELYFAKDAVEQAQKKGVYLNARRSIFVGDEGILLSNLIYKDKKLMIAVNFFYVGKEVCIQDHSPVFLGFPNNEIHSITGIQNGNCALVHNKTETGAIGMYHLPITSTLFIKLLFSLPTTISVQMNKDVGVFSPYDEQNAKDFRNAIRCAYETLGMGIDLNNENIVIDTVVVKGKK
jgi:hypothetical protein